MIHLDYADLNEHVGHELSIGPTFSGGGKTEKVSGLSIDCHTCGDTLAVAEKQRGD